MFKAGDLVRSRLSGKSYEVLNVRGGGDLQEILLAFWAADTWVDATEYVLASPAIVTNTEEDRKLREEAAKQPAVDVTDEDVRKVNEAYGAGEKPSNPKDSVGIMKVPFSRIPWPVMAEVGLGMLEGDLKYGAHNYRVIGVRASIYFDATMRHLTDWWEGQDVDMESAANLSHITKAISSLVVLRDAMIQQKFVDDRPPCAAEGWQQELSKTAKEMQEKLPRKAQPFTEDKDPQPVVLYVRR